MISYINSTDLVKYGLFFGNVDLHRNRLLFASLNLQNDPRRGPYTKLFWQEDASQEDASIILLFKDVN